MKRIINIVTLLVFCSLSIKASFAQQTVTSVWSYKDFINVKKAFFEDKSAQDKFISASMLVQAHKKNSVNELQSNLEKQQCYDYMVAISKAMGKYFDDAVNLAKALNPNATFDDDFTKDGYIKCLVHNINNKETINEILKNQNNIAQESPCSSFFKNIEQAVEIFNSKYDEKMTELDLGFLTESELLNFDTIPSSCLFTSVGDLTKDGYIKCLIHDKISKNIDEITYLKKINITKSKYKIPMSETQTIKNLVEKIKINNYFDDGTGSNNQNIGYINAKSGINLRKEPNTKSEKVCGLPYNTQVMIFDKNGPEATFENITSNWWLITDGTRVGWAFGGFIRMTK